MFTHSGADKCEFALPVFPDPWMCAALAAAQTCQHRMGARATRPQPCVKMAAGLSWQQPLRLGSLGGATITMQIHPQNTVTQLWFLKH